jgi:lipoyl synthase
MTKNAYSQVELKELSSFSERAWAESRARHGSLLTAYLPGMFVVDGRRGKYRAISITGDKCDLGCGHCKATLLRSMEHALSPDDLKRQAQAAVDRGDHGILVTGGCDREGRLPWEQFIPAIRELKEKTDLIITVHAGQTDAETARALKDAGVDQALVDVIGDDDTASDVYHLPKGTESIRRTMDSLTTAGLEIIPHIIFGIHYGRQRGEMAALKMLREYPVNKYVVVVIVPTRGTEMATIQPPPPEQVALFIARARLEMPGPKASLGCARPRGPYRKSLDVLAVRAGINSIALPSHAALDEAEQKGLEIVYKETCCSLG